MRRRFISMAEHNRLMGLVQAEGRELEKDVQDLKRVIEARDAQHGRTQRFWLCRHGFHRMDKATREATIVTPGYVGECKRCGARLRRSLV